MISFRCIEVYGGVLRGNEVVSSEVRCIEVQFVYKGLSGVEMPDSKWCSEVQSIYKEVCQCAVW